MKYRIVRTDTADAGIGKIILYVAQNFGNHVALEKLDEFENRILSLADDPYIGTEPKYPVLKRQGYKVLTLKKDLAFYKIDEINKQYEEVNRQILLLAQNQLSSEYIGGILAWPVPGYTRITSKYSMRVHPITGQYKLHTGIDIGAPEGANFIAANDGIVIKAGENVAYGNMVIVDHGGGITTLYAHGSQILVEVGQVVRRGEAVLKVGSTGYSTGPHAHFEVRINGVTTDPFPYITNGLVPGEENKEE